MGLVCFKLRSLEIRYPESLVTPEILATWFSSQVLFPSLFSLFQAQLFWLQEVQTFLSLQPLSQILSSSQDTFCYLPSSLEQISMFWKPNSPVVVKWYFSPELSSVLDQLRLQLFMFCVVLRSKAGKHKNVCWIVFYGSEEAFHSFMSCSGLKKKQAPSPCIFSSDADRADGERVFSLQPFHVHSRSSAQEALIPPGPVAIPAVHMLDDSTFSFLMSNAGCVSIP